MAYLRRAMIIQAVLIGVIALQVIVYYPRLPDRVASHFGAGGEADGWMNKQAFATFSIAFPILLAAIMLGVQAMVSGLLCSPDMLLNLPRKRYWLAPERRDETLAWVIPRLSRLMMWAGVALTAAVTIGIGMTLRANLTPEPRIPYAIPVMLTFLAPVLGASVHLTVQMYKRFWRIPQGS